jgi:hypothetical protein
MNIVVNKKFNEGYLEKYLKEIMMPTAEAFSEFKSYADKNGMVGEGDYSFIMFAPESYLKLLEVLNKKEFNGELKLDPLSFTGIINSLYDKRAEIRNMIVDYLVESGNITDNDGINIDNIKNLTASFKDFDISKLVYTKVTPDDPDYQTLKDVIIYEYNKPVELEQYYRAENNIGGEDLYLVILPLINREYGNVSDGSFGNYISTQVYSGKLQSTYIAINIGDINDDNADIKYDHVDKIDFIDSFKLKFRLPKVLS